MGKLVVANPVKTKKQIIIDLLEKHGPGLKYTVAADLFKKLNVDVSSNTFNVTKSAWRSQKQRPQKAKPAAGLAEPEIVVSYDEAVEFVRQHGGYQQALAAVKRQIALVHKFRLAAALAGVTAAEPAHGV